MRILHKIVLINLAFLFIGLRVVSQVQINFQPSAHGRSLDGITFFQINNQTSVDFNAALRIIISEEKAGKVVEVNVPSLQVKKGLNSFNRIILANSQTRFSSNSTAGMLKQTGKLPEGEYEYCYELSPAEDKPGLQDFYENCFHLGVQPLLPLLLVDPVDGEKICNQKPPFIWQPPMPVDFNARYRIIVSEVKDKQTPVEALSFNLPVINVSELREPRLNYPMNIKELEKGKNYVWQIHYSVNNILLTKSEIWTFKIDCEEEKVVKGDDSYRELKIGINGDFYVANQKLKFAINNVYNEGELKFDIVNLKNAEKRIENLPKLILITGLNRYELNLAEYKDFKNGEHYQLAVQLSNGQKLYLRFTYQE